MKKDEIMRSMYGTTPGLVCKQCVHCVRHEFSRSYYKCEAYGESRSESTDWRCKATACGLFNKPLPEDWVTVLERRKHAPRPKEPEEQLPGQISIFD